MSIEEAIKNLDIMLDSAQRRTRRNIVIPDLIEAIEMAIEALKEQIDRKWIPCFERLPDNNDTVAVWCEWIDDEGYSCGEYNVASCYNGHWYGKCLRYKVIAWMPLPEPYREEASE